MSENLRKIHDAGVAVWLDGLDRDLVRSGRLAELVRDRYVVGVATDPATWRQAIVGNATYDEQLRSLAEQGVTAEEALRAILVEDVRAAADVLRPLHDATDGADGWVSLQISPRLANRSDPTVAEAKELVRLIDRPNIVLRIPSNEAGYYAISSVVGAGISVDATHLVSHRRWRLMIDAILAGLEEAKTNGHDLRKINSVASFFLGRVDLLADERLRALGTPEALALVGKGALANAQLALQDYDKLYGRAESGQEAAEEWAGLAAAGARPTRLLWASTTVTNPELADTAYVDGLVASDVITAMSQATLDAVADHGGSDGSDAVRPNYAKALEILSGLRIIGHRLIVQTLEEEILEEARAAWKDLLDWTGAELEKLRANR
ncbi:transaldolase [Streptomyces sp. NPDC051987]|uniref:transaldolase n=1 Tax=Streptomyces sp. NPDC051987 TaxID=3155808 RepID=UPI0034142589